MAQGIRLELMSRICRKQWFEIGAVMRAFAVTSVVWSVLFGHQVAAPARTFGGYACTQHCDLHAEGFKWARVRGVDDKRRCPYGISPSFHEGCIAFIENPSRDPDEDDEGNPVGVSIEAPVGR
jgi:hypothetical protein